MTFGFKKLLEGKRARKASSSKRTSTSASCQNDCPTLCHACENPHPSSFSCTLASSNIMCIVLREYETTWSNWYLIKVAVPAASHQRAFQRVRDLVKKQPSFGVLNRCGMELLFHHCHNEQTGVEYPRIEFGQPFGYSYFDFNPGLAVVRKDFYLIGGWIKLSRSSDTLRRCSWEKKFQERTLARYSTDVRCCQISMVDLSISSFRLIPGMKSPRSDPLVIVLDGKIYIFGGIDISSVAKGPWIEEFDPVLESWNDLPTPPVKDPAKNLTFSKDYACAGLNDEIIFATLDEVCFFSVKHKVWYKTITPGIPEGIHGSSISLDGIVYWYQAEENMIFAYYPQTHQWQRKEVLGATPNINCSAIPMVYGGQDSLCLLWSIEDGLHCFRLKVSSIGNSSFLLDNEGCIWGKLPLPTFVSECWFVTEESALAQSQS